MIAYLEGKIKDMWQDKLILKTNSGVGYLIHVPQTGYLVDQEASFYIYTGVRENEISLWGFSKAQDLKLFELLLEVSGVGMKTAFGLINSVGPETLIVAIRTAHVDIIKAPGVGRKTSERIVLELKDKIDNYSWSVSATGEPVNTVKPQHQQMIDDAASAMERLGYRRNEVDGALKLVNLEDYKNAQDLVKALLVRV